MLPLLQAAITSHPREHLEIALQLQSTCRSLMADSGGMTQGLAIRRELAGWSSSATAG